jgi:hypothetical protein
VSVLRSLVTRFTDGNVTLGVLLGAISALSTVRVLLPEPAATMEARRDDNDAQTSIEPFVALLLGAVAMHDALMTIVADSRDPGDAHPDHGEAVIPLPLIGLGR